LLSRSSWPAATSALLGVHERTSLVIDLESAFDRAVAELGLAGRTVIMGDLVEYSARVITHQVLESKNPPRHHPAHRVHP
jgi:ABC-type tungstate transport system substrate-binding protein